MRKSIAFASLIATLGLTGCPEDNTADAVQRKQQEALSSEASRQVGMPGITNFTERRMLKKVLELRDQAISTHTYVMNLQGQLFHVCESLGYGLPYSTQFTNPSYIANSYSQGGFAILPQADPNGLFSPASAEGTWVACVDEKKKDYDVIYVEPRIIVSPFKLRSVGEWQLAAPQAEEPKKEFHGMDGGIPR
jgi:hypothetical protein